MAAWWSGTVAEFREADPAAIAANLAHASIHTFRVNEAAQLRAWTVSLALLRRALDGWPDPHASRLCLEFAVPRLQGRADAVLVTSRAIIVLEFKVGADGFDAASRIQAEGYALDLQDFHAGSRRAPIIPVVVATEADATPSAVLPMLFTGAVIPGLCATADDLGTQLLGWHEALAGMPDTVDVPAWEGARYDPVPGIIDAACLLFARHDVAEIAAARADATNLTVTANEIDRLLAIAGRDDAHLVILVTGIPGAGKTLCGLNAAFRPGLEGSGRAFLTGNPTLVHVLREALLRDAVSRGGDRAAAARRASSVIQMLTRFRDGGVETGHTPPERVVVIDEAQRSWTAAQAITKTRDRPVQLDRSEPAHLLDIMARHRGFAALVCLLGNGQEIHDGEGGLRTWGEALTQRPDWRVAHAPDCLDHPDPRSRLPRLPGAVVTPALHLAVPVRAIRHHATPAWVEAVLAGDAPKAAAIGASGDLPFRLTRSLPALRAALRDACRGVHRAGLVASSNARRLRGDGLGAELPHMDAGAVAHWFLDRWIGPAPDVRASDALEVVATEFSVQGLELDHVGLAWGGDLIRTAGETGWCARRFAGTRWQVLRDAEKIAWRSAAYRVLLTRARYRTVIWVPPGDDADPTRPPAVYEAVADFLRACGVPDLDRDGRTTSHGATAQQVLALHDGTE